MKFKKLNMYTNALQSELKFYTEILGFEILNQSPTSFNVKVGWTELSFTESENDHKYHYCFLIPSNKLMEAMSWFDHRTEIVDIENGRKTQNFESWNADSFYFYDASGNLAECIVRYDLKNEANEDFDLTQVLAVNEVGVPSGDVEKLNEQLEKELKTEFWKGDLKRFGTNGSQEGIFLLPNYNIKATWFPTQLKLKPEPFEATIKNGQELFEIRYKNEKLSTSCCTDKT